MSKLKAILISGAVGVCLFLPIDFLTGWDAWFPFVHPFNLLTVACWSVILYWILRRKLTVKACKSFAALTLLFALPQALFTVLVYSAWICVGGSVAVAIGLLLWCHRFKKRNADDSAIS